MVLKKTNNLVLIFIILCSTSFYQLTALGQAKRLVEILGIFIIIILLIFYIIYSENKTFKHNFTIPIILIIISLISSSIMAKYIREQNFTQSIYAHRAIYYYLLYFLLHQMKIKPRDLEMIIFGLGVLYVGLYLLQYFLYPTKIYDAYVRSDRGTIRIYLAGAGYFGIAFYMALQYFYRTNKLYHLFFLIVFFSIHVLTGGRQTLAITALVVVLFLLFDKHVKSRLFLAFLGITGIALLLYLFQGVFESIMMASEKDISKGDEYIRFLAAEYFLTDFFKHPLAYITGNGMFNFDSAYGKEIAGIVENDHFNLSDIGIIGNYAMYGAFFVTGVFSIIYKALKMKIEKKHHYIRYTFIGIILAIMTAGNFAYADFICLMMCILYLIDVSNYSETKHKLET